MCGGFIGDIFDTVGNVVSGIFGGGGDNYTPLQLNDVETPQQLDLSQENTAQTALDQSLESDHRRGMSSNVQTSGSGALLGDTSRKKLLGG